MISGSTSGQSPGITGANLQGMAMAARCWRYSTDGIWLANPYCRSSLDAAYFTLGSGSDRPAVHYEGGQAFALGRPLYFSEECQTQSTQGDVVLAVWSEYLLGVRKNGTLGIEHTCSLRELRVNLRFTFRGTGAPWWRAALTPRNSSETLSPFVALDYADVMIWRLPVVDA